MSDSNTLKVLITKEALRGIVEHARAQAGDGWPSDVFGEATDGKCGLRFAVLPHPVHNGVFLRIEWIEGPASNLTWHWEQDEAGEFTFLGFFTSPANGPTQIQRIEAMRHAMEKKRLEAN
ncbi:MAG: hypothetical protein ICCCNLDF_02834 [Planctomycetes bacterium]|nr:hypothetical protein [Planctomycetota bacterium]